MDRRHLHVDGPWTFIEGVRDGHPIVIRLNTSLAPLAGSAEFPLQVGIAVKLHEPRENGMPGADEGADLHRIEDDLFVSLAHANMSLFAAVITMNGMREFVFYTADEALVRTRVGEIRAIVWTHEMQLIVRPDPTWAVYRELAARR